LIVPIRAPAALFLSVIDHSLFRSTPTLIAGALAVDLSANNRQYSALYKLSRRIAGGPLFKAKFWAGGQRMWLSVFSEARAQATLSHRGFRSTRV
jgi:hypothetical protein